VPAARCFWCAFRRADRQGALLAPHKVYDFAGAPHFAKAPCTPKATRAQSAPRCPCFVVSQTIKPFVSLLAAVFATREFKPQTDHCGTYMPMCCPESFICIDFDGYTPSLVSTDCPWRRAVREAIGRVLRCGCLSCATLARSEFAASPCQTLDGRGFAAIGRARVARDGARPVPCSSGGRNRRFTACAAGHAIFDLQHQLNSLAK
jgi:hypothetical protein